MQGSFTGYYKHDDAFMQKETGFDKTGFTITISEFDGKNFSGTVTDDINTGGMPETGIIKGRLTHNGIAFTKQMPVLTQVHPSNGRIRNEHKKHNLLYYSGTYNAIGQLQGAWKFGLRVGFLFGFIPIPYRPGTGTWLMEKTAG